MLEPELKNNVLIYTVELQEAKLDHNRTDPIN